MTCPWPRESRMTLERVIIAATHLAGAVESGGRAEARRLTGDVIQLAGQSALQTVAQAAQRVLAAFAEGQCNQFDLEVAMIALADQIDRLVHAAMARAA